MAKIGDIVTWRAGGKPKPDAKFIPIGIANCTVLALAKAANGRPAVKLKLPAVMGYPKPVLVYADHVYEDK